MISFHVQRLPAFSASAFPLHSTQQEKENLLHLNRRHVENEPTTRFSPRVVALAACVPDLWKSEAGQVRQILEDLMRGPD